MSEQILHGIFHAFLPQLGKPSLLRPGNVISIDSDIRAVDGGDVAVGVKCAAVAIAVGDIERAVESFVDESRFSSQTLPELDLLLFVPFRFVSFLLEFRQFGAIDQL